MSAKEATSKVWFVTGGSSGFGRAMAEEALARGERVVIAARDVRAVAELAHGAPGRVHVVRLDLTKREEIEAAVRSALDRFGAIDVLVNSAGFGLVGAVEETSDEELREVMEVMFFGPVALTRALLPHMRGRGAGTIVQLTGMGAITTWPGFGAAAAAKHALEGLSESMADEVTALGVRVLLVEPGLFRTKLWGAAFRRMPPIDAYAPSVGPTRAWAAQLEGGQGADPARAACAIADAVAAGVPTLRLPLGGDAVDGIRAKLAAIAADVDRNEAVARGVAERSSSR